MAKLNINLTDTKDIITQSKNLTEAQRKEAQLIRLLLNQGLMPVLNEGQTGKFVQMGRMAFKSKPVSESQFTLNLMCIGNCVGITYNDVLDTYYENQAIAMAFCNHIQKKLMENIGRLDAEQAAEFVGMIERNLGLLGESARAAGVNLGVVLAAEQATKTDLKNLKTMVNKKADAEELE